MTAAKLANGLAFIVSRVGDGHFVRAAKHCLYIDVDLKAFAYEDREFLADYCSIYEGDECFIAYPHSEHEKK